MSRFPWLVLSSLLLAACGEDNPGADAGVVDAGPDASTPDAPTDGPTAGVVALSVTDGGAPVMGVSVYFQNADSSLVAMVTTDASGVASATMEPGGFVTAIQPFPSLAESGVFIKTFAGVKPGDQLTLILQGRPAPRAMEIIVPYAADAADYEISTSCGLTGAPPIEGAVPQPLSLPLGECGPRMDVLAKARDAAGVTIGQIYLPDQDVVVDGSLTVPGTYQPPTASTFAITGAPSAMVDTIVSTVTPRGELQNSYGIAQLTAGAGTLALPRLVLAGSTLVGRYAPVASPAVADMQVLAWGPDAAATTIDLGAALLPDYAVLPTVDVATHAVTWTPAGTGVTPDLAYTQFSALRTAADLTTTAWRWSIAAPYTSGAVTLPVLPAAAAIYNPVATDQVNVFDLTTGKLPGGYDAARATVLNRRAAWLSGPVGAQPSGLVSVARLSN